MKTEKLRTRKDTQIVVRQRDKTCKVYIETSPHSSRFKVAKVFRFTSIISLEEVLINKDILLIKLDILGNTVKKQLNIKEYLK